MKFTRYLNESKMGKLSQTIKRTAYLKEYPELLKWELLNPDTDYERTNYKAIEAISWKELMDMKNKKILDFYEDNYSLYDLGNRGYEATVTLKNYDPKKLSSALRKLKFKVK